MFRNMSAIGFKINDMNTMGLVLEPLDPQEEPEPLQVQLWNGCHAPWRHDGRSCAC